ncbi:hypothetical protein, partial [Cereibacter sphaeroides]|uniref:hypothetical protein n=1 Tax=Cereibacter sphaeroides TaxID=1063 RepID=UPI001F22B4DD
QAGDGAAQRQQQENERNTHCEALARCRFSAKRGVGLAAGHGRVRLRPDAVSALSITDFAPAAAIAGVVLPGSCWRR